MKFKNLKRDWNPGVDRTRKQADLNRKVCGVQDSVAAVVVTNMLPTKRKMTSRNQGWKNDSTDSRVWTRKPRDDNVQ